MMVMIAGRVGLYASTSPDNDDAVLWILLVFYLLILRLLSAPVWTPSPTPASVVRRDISMCPVLANKKAESPNRPLSMSSSAIRLSWISVIRDPRLSALTFR